MGAAIIKKQDVIASVTDALQFMSYYHPVDFIQALGQAYQDEQSPAAKDAIAQILTNSRMCAEGKRPLCQDTGIVVVFVEIGIEARFEAGADLEDWINQGVRLAYTHADNPLRASIVSDPAGKRSNTKDNTPAVIHTRSVPGNQVNFMLAAKGGGSENKAKLAMLNPSDDLVEWIAQVVQDMGAGWCPPGVLGIGIGGTAEKAVLMAKQSLMQTIDLAALRQRGASNRIEELRLQIADRVNALGIGAQGLGGLTTVLDVKIIDYPTHAASLPVAVIPNCAATRHAHFSLNGEGPAMQKAPRMEDWPEVFWQPNPQSRRVNLDTLTREQMRDWQPGETLLLSGKLLTGRDAAHKKIAELFAQGLPLPAGVDFTNRMIYYVGPVDPVGNEAVGPAGPTTATRMDKFTDMMLAKTGLLGMIGKAERGPQAIQSIRQHAAVYLIAVGGAAYLVSKAIRSAKVLAFPELGMEAIYEFEVQDMPVTVAVDVQGQSVHQTGPKQWQNLHFQTPSNT